jgi:erythromycin esterase-like protein
MDEALLGALRERALPLRGPGDLDPLLARIGDARFVLLGESTHGTHEFYAERVRITRRLIAEKGFAAVAVEGDGPDAHRVDRFVRGRGDDDEAVDALGDFRRFPAWMWRNADVLDLVGWLRAHNEPLPPERRVAFHGLDLYAMHAAMRAVIAWLATADADAAERARARYGCFEDFGEDPHEYGAHAGFGIRPDCGPAVTEQLVELLRQAAERRDVVAGEARDDDFFALQCARLVVGAEAYYKAAFGGRSASWNLRDEHMADTLDRLAEHLVATGRSPKVVVWAHNSHVGDARASDLGRSGELSLGQLCRERHRAETVVVGFSTHHGTVTAADGWDRPAGRMAVRPAAPDTYEDLLHRVGIDRFLLDLHELGEAGGALAEERFERAIGVVYKPATERWSHLFRACLPRRFDLLVHVDETRAVEPLERTSRWEVGELPETFPSAL